tara:strand:- start:84 stop:965 length:882 start_codon:yes stop_codon:yes gene_type:complete
MKSLQIILTLIIGLGLNTSESLEKKINKASIIETDSYKIILNNVSDSIAIAKRAAYYTEHSEKGNLTKDREGVNVKANVPKGPKGQDNSGITLAFGIDLAAGFSKASDRQKIANTIDAKGYLREWIMRAPATRGSEARTWLKTEGNECPVFNEAQINNLYEFGYEFFLKRAKKRLMGTTGYKIADVLPEFRLTEDEFDDLALDPNAPDEDYIYELLADIAWNSAQFARGRQNKIAQALRVDQDTLSRAEKQIIRLNALRILIDKKIIPTSRTGRINRLGWIDSKVEILKLNNY